jgi:hypothetical protein
VPDYQPTYTINEFCEAERISRSLLYKLWDQGAGPRFHRVGSRWLHQEWRERLEVEASDRGGE